MRKEDWLRLAMPASITLLAMAIVATPLLSNAQISQSGNRFDPIYVKLMECPGSSGVIFCGVEFDPLAFFNVA